jgi:hypothetical protein
MAISAEKKLSEYGVTVSDLYIRIANMEFSVPDSQFVALDVMEYLSKDFRTQGIVARVQRVSMPMSAFKEGTLFNTDSLLKSAYAWLHTQGMYSKVKDC